MGTCVIYFDKHKLSALICVETIINLFKQSFAVCLTFADDSKNLYIFLFIYLIEVLLITFNKNVYDIAAVPIFYKNKKPVIFILIREHFY